METRYTVRQATDVTGVKSYVLRYWEDELGLNIRRNELGHRYYTGYDIQLFLNIKELKRKGLQLRAIRDMIPQMDLSSSDAVLKGLFFTEKMKEEHPDADGKRKEEHPDADGKRKEEHPDTDRKRKEEHPDADGKRKEEHPDADRKMEEENMSDKAEFREDLPEEQKLRRREETEENAGIRAAAPNSRVEERRDLEEHSGKEKSAGESGSLENSSGEWEDNTGRSKQTKDKRKSEEIIQKESSGGTDDRKAEKKRMKSHGRDQERKEKRNIGNLRETDRSAVRRTVPSNAKILEFQAILERLIAQELQAKNEEEERCRSLDLAIRRQQLARREAAAANEKRSGKKQKI